MEVQMLHQLKIKQCYLYHIREGKKTFEVRKNDRDFQVGDTIRFLPLEDENYNVYEFTAPLPDYRINYILSDFSGLQQNHVCLAITPITA
jgi:ASC-1-like (ASCH) protein